MSWVVRFHEKVDSEFDGLPEAVQDDLLAQSKLLEHLKELRFDAADGVWRVAFAFDSRREAILLVAGDKSGGGEQRFYRQLIRTADERFDGHLARVKPTTKRKGTEQWQAHLRTRSTP
jgi:hypothetical protein